jgi:hypothetical protein
MAARWSGLCSGGSRARLDARYGASSAPRQEFELRSFKGREMEKPVDSGPNEMRWGAHLVKMTIFFDNVFRIPPSNQRGKFCIACGSQATFVKLDGDGEPLAFYCDGHVVEARR